MTLIEKIINIETGETTLRNYTKQEIESHDAERSKYALERAAKDAADGATATAKAALLAKLGITADEAKLLLG